MTNDELDTKVLEAIRSGKTRASAVQAHLGLEKSRQAILDVDRSLQRLRKRELIRYGGPGTTFSGWRLVAP